MSQALEPSHGSTSTGIAPNVGAGLSYLVSPIAGIIFLLVEKENAYLRFHAAQALVVGVAWWAVWFVLRLVTGTFGWIPFLGPILTFALVGLVGLAALGLWIYLLVKAFGGHDFELPVAGKYAHQLADAVKPAV